MFYVFVLMELQSSAQRFMALRLLGYLLQLCEALLEHGKYLAARRPRRLLPPVLAVVLYNGEKPWTAPLSLAELFKPMEGYTPPDFRYVVLDVNRYPPQELRPVEDVTSGVFLLEQSKDVAESSSSSSMSSKGSSTTRPGPGHRVVGERRGDQVRPR